MDNCDAAVWAEQEISVVGGEMRRRMAAMGNICKLTAVTRSWLVLTSAAAGVVLEDNSGPPGSLRESEVLCRRRSSLRHISGILSSFGFQDEVAASMRAVRRLESHAAVTQAATLPPPPAPPPSRRLSPEAEERKPAITINYLSPPRHSSTATAM